MPLSSPRFKSSRDLRNAAANNPPLAKGARGRAVHLVQMALLDLGYAMPNSTGGMYSPDGIFGDETERVVKQFQRDNRDGTGRLLKDDGVIGRNTMEALDRRFPKFERRVNLHFRSLSLTDVPFHGILADTETIYSQYGIQVFFASGESLGLTPEEEAEFNIIDQDCKWVLSDGEFHRLQSLGSRAPANDVLVYYVSTFGNAGLLGCGGHAPNRPALTVAKRASRWDTAHELGHVLLGSSFSPVHVNNTRNLMHPTAARYSDIPVLTDSQVVQIRRSPCCRAV